MRHVQVGPSMVDTQMIDWGVGVDVYQMIERDDPKHATPTPCRVIDYDGMTHNVVRTRFTGNWHADAKVQNLERAAQSAHTRYLAAVKQAEALQDEVSTMRDKIEALEALIRLGMGLFSDDTEVSGGASAAISEAVDFYERHRED